jgi:hypothetical protein
MSRFLWAMTLAVAVGCAGSDDPATNTEGTDGLAAFDPSVVIYADGGECAVAPGAEDCINLFPAGVVTADADQASGLCDTYGYECCDPSGWISPEAAQCIAEADARMVTFLDMTVDVHCNEQIKGPIFGVYQEDMGGGGFRGVGVHAATGEIIWFEDDTGFV